MPRLWDLTPLNDLRRDPRHVACQCDAGALDPEVWTFFSPGIDYRIRARTSDADQAHRSGLLLAVGDPGVGP
jgi:hypothetical protein